MRVLRKLLLYKAFRFCYTGSRDGKKASSVSSGHARERKRIGLGSRMKNTKRNLLASWVLTAVTMLFQFVFRALITHYLGEQYLGLSSLFTSLLQVLNMAELGFSGAIVYNMYKPLANHDTETVNALLAYYQRIYRTIGLIVLTVGLLLMPLIPHLITAGYPADINLYVLYALYLANTVISYFLFAYRTSLLEALQRLDLVKTVYTVVTLLQYGLQLIALTVLKNYYCYVICMVLGTAGKNIAVAILSRRAFPEYRCQGRLADPTRRDITSRVRGLLICNISQVTFTTFDSIILSAFIGLAAVAHYNNYGTIRAGVATIILLIQQAMQASVGNSVASESLEKNYRDLEQWQCLFSVVTAWCTACMLSLLQPFMTLWMGADQLLPMKDAVLVCAWFFVSEVQHSYLLYLNAAGLWWNMRWTYVGSAVTNLGLNLILGKYWGITGVLLATVFSTLVFGSVWQCNIIFRDYFHRSPVTFHLRQLRYFLSTALVSGLTYFFSSRFHFQGIQGFLALLFFCVFFSGTMLYLLFRRMPVFRSAVVLLKKAWKEKLR